MVTPTDAIAKLISTANAKLQTEAALRVATDLLAKAQADHAAATTANDSAHADAMEAMPEGRLYTGDPNPKPVWVRIGDTIRAVTPEVVALPVAAGPTATGVPADPHATPAAESHPA